MPNTDSLNRRIDDLKESVTSGFKDVKEILAFKVDANCEKIIDNKVNIITNTKRISKLEKSFAYQVGKIAGISAVIGSISSLIVLYMR